MKNFISGSYMSRYPSFKAERGAFYEQFILETDIITVYQLLRRTSSIATSVCHRLENPNFPFGAHPRKIAKLHGKPNYKFHKENFTYHMVWSYRSSFYKNDCYINCHFLNDELFYIHFCFPDSRWIEHKVLPILYQKYGCDVLQMPSGVLQSNVDNHKLFIDRDIYLNLYYISGDPFYEQGIAELLAQNRKMEKVKEKNLICYLNELL